MLTMPKKAATWGARLKAMRESKGYTQQTAARALNMPVRTLQCWEQGYSTPPIYLQKWIMRAVQELHSV